MGCGAREKEGRREVSQVCCFVGVFSHDTGHDKGNRVSRECATPYAIRVRLRKIPTFSYIAYYYENERIESRKVRNSLTQSE